MRFLIITTSILTGIILNSGDINTTGKDNFPPNLEKKFKEYWNLKARKEYKKAYKFELPYQRFLYGIKWYEKFNSQSQENNYSIILHHLQLKDKNTAIIKAQKIGKDYSYYFIDQWFLVNGKWYHKMRTSYLPAVSEE